MPNYTYTRGRPDGSLTPSSQRTDMQTNNDSIDSIWTVDHYGFNDIDGGYHQKSTYPIQSSDPGSAANQAVQYSKTSGSSSELFLQRDAVSTAIQLTYGTVSQASSGYSFIPGGMRIQWGSATSLGSGSTANVSYPTAFASAVYAVILTPLNQTGASYTYWVSDISNLSHFVLSVTGTLTGAEYYFYAIGV